MSTFQRFQDIEAWQRARELTRAVYSASSTGQFAKDFGLRDQIRRASVSVMGNIAEGYERDGTREFLQYLSVAKASAAEVESHLYVALDQNYLAQAEFERLVGLSKSTRSLLAGLMRYLRQSEYRGVKYAKLTLGKTETRDEEPETRDEERF